MEFHAFTEGLNKRLDFVQVMSRHGWKQVVLYLEIEMSCEPIIEEGLFNITCSLHLEPDPWLSGITIYVHRDVV